MPQNYFYAGGGDPYSAIAGQQRAWDDDLRGDQRFQIQQMQQAEAAQRDMANRQAQYDFQLASESRQAARQQQEQARRAASEERNLGFSLEQQRYDRANDRAKQERDFGLREREFGFRDRQEKSQADVLEFNRKRIYKEDALDQAATGKFASANDVMEEFPNLTGAEQYQVWEASERKRQEKEAQWRFAESVAEAKRKHDRDMALKAQWRAAADSKLKPNEISEAQRAITGEGTERFTPSRFAATQAEMLTRGAWVDAAMKKNPNIIREDDGGGWTTSEPRPSWVQDRVTPVAQPVTAAASSPQASAAAPRRNLSKAQFATEFAALNPSMSREQVIAYVNARYVP